MLNSLQNNVIAAIILVLIIILGALGVRSGLLVGVSIPGSFLSGLLALSVMGFTINIVVLFALILSVGLLVDGAIVVVEYADRKMKEGLGVKDAFVTAWNYTRKVDLKQAQIYLEEQRTLLEKKKRGRRSLRKIKTKEIVYEVLLNLVPTLSICNQYIQPNITSN